MCSPVPFKSDDDGEGRGRIDGQDTSMAIQRKSTIIIFRGQTFTKLHIMCGTVMNFPFRNLNEYCIHS